MVRVFDSGAVSPVQFPVESKSCVSIAAYSITASDSVAAPASLWVCLFLGGGGNGSKTLKKSSVLTICTGKCQFFCDFSQSWGQDSFLGGGKCPTAGTTTDLWGWCSV